MKILRRSYESRVDAVVAVISDRRFPVQLYFLKDGIAVGVVAQGKKNRLAPPGVTPEKGIHGESPEAATLLQDVLRLTDIGYVPKGVIRDAVRETWRRKFNELQMEEAQRQLQEKQAALDPSVVTDVVNLKE